MYNFPITYSSNAASSQSFTMPQDTAKCDELQSRINALFLPLVVNTIGSLVGVGYVGYSIILATRTEQINRANIFLKAGTALLGINYFLAKPKIKEYETHLKEKAITCNTEGHFLNKYVAQENDIKTKS